MSQEVKKVSRDIVSQFVYSLFLVRFSLMEGGCASLSLFEGSCASRNAANMMVQPQISRPETCSFKKMIPDITAKTDSNDKIKEAMVGSVYFCPRICRV